MGTIECVSPLGIPCEMFCLYSVLLFAAHGQACLLTQHAQWQFGQVHILDHEHFIVLLKLILCLTVVSQTRVLFIVLQRDLNVTNMSDDQFQKFVQYMIVHGCVKEEKLSEIYGDFSQLMQKANKELKRFSMMIRGSMDEITTDRYYVLISTVDNHITHAATQYNPKQYEFFKLILQAIVNNPRGIITDRDLKPLAEKATLTEHKSLFEEWCSRNWFTIVSEDRYDFITLGVRSIAELDVFIKNKLIEKADDLDCKGCGTMAIYSVSCPKCDSRFHKRCAKLSIDHETGSCKVCLRISLSQPQPSTSSVGSRPRKTVSRRTRE